MVEAGHATGNPVWGMILDALQKRRAGLCREIRGYPTPIAGCDVQFNGLLEEREALGREIARLDEARAAEHGEEGAQAVTAFLATSRFLDADVARRIAALLKKQSIRKTA
jgi:hypothetical protein